MTHLKSEFLGRLKVVIVRDKEGSSDLYGGTHMASRHIDTSRLSFYRVLQAGEGVTQTDANVLFSFSALSSAGVAAVRARVEKLQGPDGKGEVTREAILEALI